VERFLLTLGGVEQATGGLLLPDQPIPEVGEYGGPTHDLTAAELADFTRGRAMFDFEFGLSDGVGAPRYNGDSCRACHFEPVIGGAGPRGVSVIRHGILDAAGDYTDPSIGSILHRINAIPGTLNAPEEDVSVFELRSTPSLLGMGLVDTIEDAVIEVNADPDDADGDGISGRVNYLVDDRIGRFGWKGQVPSLDEFARDAVSAEMGLTMPAEPGLSFGKTQDSDSVPDPEISLAIIDDLRLFMALLGAPPRQTGGDAAAISRGDRGAGSTLESELTA
jgi:CxxC motif-containing protein (DUF1111 family)